MLFQVSTAEKHQCEHRDGVITVATSPPLFKKSPLICHLNTQMTAKTIDSAEGHQCQRGQRYYLWARQNTLKDKVAKNCNFGNYLLTPVQMWSRVKFHSLPEIKTSLNELSKLLQHNHIASCFLGQNLYCSCWAKGVSTHPIWSAFTTPTAYSGYNHTFSYQFLGSFCF